ncbi:MAG: hypothetical protein DRO11_05095 [Methanobacteriota archaeon]|nr:MAG: hypothetical protein DRO11_05095 [Euryarchaeota archaeon]
MTSLRIVRDESAQAGGVFVFIAAIAIFSMLYILFGRFIDEIISINNEMLSSLHYSQEFADTMNMAFTWWYALPFIVLIASAIWLIKNAIAARSEVVE